MPGKRVTDHQVNKYKQLRRTLSQEAAATKVGVSVRTARRMEAMSRLPSQREPRAWRTREDPLEAVWDSEVVPMLKSAPGLTAVTLLEELQRRHPGRYPEGLLRTLQRRVRQWKALEGADREVFFAQEHEPGRLGLSDFTHGGELGVTVGREPLGHLLYQFALAYSGWRHAEVVLGGESFLALSMGLQNALWSLGGVPREHRTDSLSAAFRNPAEQDDLTRRYESLCEHYGMAPSRNNRGASHENGSIEARHGTLKRFLEQALLLRGNSDFDSVEQYRQFVADVVLRANSRVNKAVAIERTCLATLPVRRTSDYEEIDARVTKFALFTVRHVLYSAPSRLIGHRLKVRLYGERVEAYLGGVCVVQAARGAGKGSRVIDYRHMLPELKRKPGALIRWRMRDALFPRSEYAQTWQRLFERVPEKQAARTMVGLLEIAADGFEVALAHELGQLIAEDTLPELEALRRRFTTRVAKLPHVVVQLPALASYDELVEAA